MDKKGYVLVYRSVKDNWIWNSKEPFDKRSAWIDLILTANHQDKKINFNGQLITVKRGEMITSFRVLSDRWQWSKNKVSNFLNQLESDGMIVTKRDTRFTLIKLEKYDFYQYSKEPKRTPKGQSRDTERTPKGQNNTLNTFNTLNKTLSKDSVCDINAHPHGRFQNVFLTDEEYEAYKKEHPDIDEIIEELSEAIDTDPKRYQEGHPTSWVNKFIRQKRKTTKAPERRKMLT